MLPKLLFLLLVLAPVCFCKLLQTYVLFRHGARTPLSFFYEPNQYSEKIGDLTPVGRQQVRELGSRLREKYITELHLVDSKYNPEQVYVKSSIKVRTNESTNHLLEGLFPDEHPSAVRVNYVSTIRDLYYHAHKESLCPLVGPILERLKDSDEYIAATEYYKQKLFPSIGNALNTDGKHNISIDKLSIKQAKKIFDGYKCNLVNGKSNPNFSQQDIDLFYQMNLWHLYKYKFGSKLVMKLTNSPIFQEIDRFLDCTFSSDGSSSDSTDHKGCPKLILFSAHDSNIVPFLKSLVPIEQLLSDRKFVPRFAADLIVEVHQDRDHKEPWIQVLYNDEPLYIWGKGEADRIQFSEFKQFLKENIFEDTAGVCDGEAAPEGHDD